MKMVAETLSFGPKGDLYRQICSSSSPEVARAGDGLNSSLTSKLLIVRVYVTWPHEIWKENHIFVWFYKL